MAGGEVKAHELKSKSKADLSSQLTELKTELLQLRVAKVTGGNTAKLTKIAGVRRSIARVNTVISHKQRESLREFYKGKKYAPLDLRVKKTRAIRKQMTKFETSRTTERQKKKAAHFPKRAYAIKA